jgi:hypothetical protein
VADAAKTDDAKKETGGPDTAAGPADFDKLSDQLRSRVDLFGKALAGLATVGTTAVSLTTVNNLAPGTMESWSAPWGYALAALGFLLLGGGCAIGVAVRLMRVNQPVVLDTDPSSSLDYGSAANGDVQQIYKEVAEQNGFTTLSGLQSQVRALRATAGDALSDAERARRLELAARGQVEVDRAIARARWSVVRREASRASGGRLAICMYLGVLIGLLGFAFCSDMATDPEDDDIKVAQSCAQARSAGAVDADLEGSACQTPTATGTPSDDESKDAPPGEESDKDRAIARHAALARVAHQLQGVVAACNDLARTETETDSPRPLDGSDCEGLEAALDGVLSAMEATSDEDDPAPSPAA